MRVACTCIPCTHACMAPGVVCWGSIARSAIYAYGGIPEDVSPINHGRYPHARPSPCQMRMGGRRETTNYIAS